MSGAFTVTARCACDRCHSVHVLHAGEAAVPQGGLFPPAAVFPRTANGSTTATLATSKPPSDVRSSLSFSTLLSYLSPLTSTLVSTLLSSILSPLTSTLVSTLSCRPLPSLVPYLPYMMLYPGSCLCQPLYCMTVLPYLIATFFTMLRLTCLHDALAVFTARAGGMAQFRAVFQHQQTLCLSAFHVFNVHC